MSDGKGDAKNERNDAQELTQAPFTHDPRSFVLVLLPKPANVSGGGSGVARDKVARAHSSRNVGALGEVLPLVAGGEDAAVTSGSGSAPGSYLAFFSDYCKCPSGVDELYGAPANVVLSKDVDNPYTFIANLNPGKPEEQKGCCGYEGYSGQRDKCHGKAFADQNHNPRESHDDKARESYGSAGSGSEYLHSRSLACWQEVLNVG